MVQGTDDGSAQRAEVDWNYEVFRRKLPDLLITDADRFALMRDGEIVECFDTSHEAIEAGRRRFGSLPFSVQEVTDRPVDLGYLSHAGVLGSL